MKVLQINSHFNKGSTGRIVKDLYDIQKKNGINAYVMYGVGDLSEEKNVYKINTKLGYYIHKYKTHFLGGHGFYSSYHTKKAIKVINEIKPDIIHLHNLHGHYLNCEVLFNYIKENNIPIVWTFHDCWSFTGHCAYFTKANCFKWKTTCQKCELKYEYPRTIWDKSKYLFLKKRKLFCNVKKIQIVTVSNWLEKIVNQSFFNKYNIKTISNYIDPKNFNVHDKILYNIRDQFKINDKKIILGVALGWRKGKGFDDFLKLSKIIGKDKIIFIVGKAPINKLPNNMLNIPATENRRDLADIYRSADIFFNPSREETFGLTTVEAMACGTPVVVYKTTACPEVIGNNESTAGIAVELNNYNDANNAIEKIIKNYEYYQKNALERVHRNYLKNEQLEKYLMMYKSIIEENNEK